MTQNLTKETGQQCFLPSKGLWGRTACTPWRWNSYPGRAPALLGQLSVSTTQTGTEKQTHQIQPPGHCSALSMVPTMNHQRHRRVQGALLIPHTCEILTSLPVAAQWSCSDPHRTLWEMTSYTLPRIAAPPACCCTPALPRHPSLGRNLGTDRSYPDL